MSSRLLCSPFFRVSGELSAEFIRIVLPIGSRVEMMAQQLADVHRGLASVRVH
jgi:hypothetical protein